MGNNNEGIVYNLLELRDIKMGELYEINREIDKLETKINSKKRIIQ